MLVRGPLIVAHEQVLIVALQGAEHRRPDVGRAGLHTGLVAVLHSFAVTGLTAMRAHFGTVRDKPAAENVLWTSADMLA